MNYEVGVYISMLCLYCKVVGVYYLWLKQLSGNFLISCVGFENMLVIIILNR